MNKIGNKRTNKTGKIQLKKTTRLIALAIISLILLLSLIATILAYQTPTITVETKTVAEYSQSSSYAYLVYLKNNTLYEIPLLLPNQGIYFKQIIDNITASITYNYQSSLPGPIHANYSMNAEIKTDLWTKKYPLINQTSFTSTDKITSFTQIFPINYSFYDDEIGEINTETGITAPNPKVIIHTNVFLSQTTSQGTIYTQFAPELSMTLNQKTLEISKNLTSTQTGSLTQQTTQYHQSVLLQRNIYTAITVSMGILLCVVFIITKNKPDEKTEIEKTIKKIYKRNGEWIHKTVTPPPTALQHTLRFASIEDLIKIGEDLNKPIFHYSISNPQRHIFYILDTTTTYLYELNAEENKNQNSPLTK
jgi:hypothetical protein